METMIGWHFSAEPRLAYGDGRPIVAGETLVIDPPIELCNRGLHASSQAIDALRYAPGSFVSRVELSGEIIKGNDKAVATHRKTLWIADATQTLYLFARQCALDVSHYWNMPDCVRAYLETGQEHLREDAWSAADAAANAAANAAAWAATNAAAWAAADAAADAAAWAAADAAARNAQTLRLENLLTALGEQK